MSTIERIVEMKKNGISDSGIVNTLKSEGVSQKEIDSFLSQANIKSAVEETEDIKAPQDLDQLDTKKEKMVEEYEGMQPSMLNTEQDPHPQSQEYPPQQYNSPQAPQYDQQPQQYSNNSPGQQGYEQYSYPSSGVSADTISEISEQVVSEKLSSIKDQLEKAIDSKSLMESKLSSLDERLKRMEKIIDRLQLSVLQKVGDYMTNVEDIKQELAETQKTFKALVPQSNQSQRRFTEQTDEPQQKSKLVSKN